MKTPPHPATDELILALVDTDNKPLANKAISLKQNNSTVFSGLTNQEGKVIVKDFDPDTETEVISEDYYIEVSNATVLPEDEAQLPDYNPGEPPTEGDYSGSCC